MPLTPHIELALLFTFLSVLCIHADPNASAPPCEPDNVFSDDVCRPFTDTECTTRYGDISSFDSLHNRCVWRPPDAADVSPLRDPAGTDHCVLPRRLLAMFRIANPDGDIALIPAGPAGNVAEQLVCGRVDLRPWSSAAFSVFAEINAPTKRLVPIWWAVLLIVLLSLAVPALLTGVACIGREIYRIRQKRRTFAPPREPVSEESASEPCHTASSTPCEKIEKTGENPEMG